VAALSNVQIPKRLLKHFLFFVIPLIDFCSSEFAVSNNSNVITATSAPNQTESQQLDFRHLLQQFHATQKRHYRRRQKAVRRDSLMKQSKTEEQSKEEPPPLTFLDSVAEEEEKVSSKVE
jgi:hypothetical protein